MRRLYRYDCLAAEQMLANLAQQHGCQVVRATREQNRLEDIDLWIDGIAVSVKQQEAGLRFGGDISLELISQIPGLPKLPPNHRLHQHAKRSRGKLDLPWRYGWFTMPQAKAEEYWIVQGGEVRIFRKRDILNYLDEYGFDKVFGLSQWTLAQQKEQDTVSGYLTLESQKKIGYLSQPVNRVYNGGE